jgi:hypothetical protein
MTTSMYPPGYRRSPNKTQPRPKRSSCNFESTDLSPIDSCIAICSGLDWPPIVVMSRRIGSELAIFYSNGPGNRCWETRFLEILFPWIVPTRFLSRLFHLSNSRTSSKRFEIHSLRAAKQQPGDTRIPRQLAAIGSWALDHHQRDTAVMLLKDADELAEHQGPGEHELWVADLADRLGQEALSIKLQQGLLIQRCLPASRIAPRLARIKQSGDADTALRLAIDASTYCLEPNVQNLAGKTAPSY